MAAHRPGQAHPSPGELLGNLRVAGSGHGDFAVGLRDGKAEDAQPLHLLDELLRVLVGVLKLARDRSYVPVNEIGDGVDDGLFFLGQVGHAAVLSR